MNIVLNNYSGAMLMQMMQLQRLAEAGTFVNTTTGYVNAQTGVGANTGAMSVGMKEYYDTYMLDNARSKHIFAQFGRKEILPANHGMTMEWRKWNTLPPADILREAVVPTGKPFGETAIVGAIRELGMYVPISKQLETHHVDKVMAGVVEELGASAGDTKDIAVRNAVCEGTNVVYAPKLVDGEEIEVEGRWALDETSKLTPDLVNQVFTFMRTMKVPEIDGKYVCVLHPHCAYELRRSDEWISAHQYAHPEEIYNGEIGELHNVRFMVSENAPVWRGTALNGETQYLTLAGDYTGNDVGGQADWGAASSYKATISETPNKDHVGRFVHMYDTSASKIVGTAKIVGVNIANKSLWFDIPLPVAPASGDKLYPGEGAGLDSNGNVTLGVYGCLFFGKDAFGVIEAEGGGLEMIIKSREEVGGPLNQYGTAGYKLEEGSKILYQERVVRLECCSPRYSKKAIGNMVPFKYAE